MSGRRSRTVLLVHYRLFADDWAAWLTNAGHHVEWLVPQTLTVEFVRAACQALAPRFIASINFSPELALLATLGQTPYVSWTVDPLGPQRFTLYDGTDPRLSVAFAHRRSTVERLGKAGIAASFLPLGAPAERRRELALPSDAAEPRFDVSFVGSSLADEARQLDQLVVDSGGDAALVADFRRFVDRELDAHEGDVTYAGMGDDGASLPAELLARFGARQPPLALLADRVNGALSHALRARRVHAVSKHTLGVFGDAGWSASPSYRGAAKHGDELTRIYNASALNLDVPRVYQRDIVTMRVFDVLSCAGVVLTEPSADLAELFADGTELVTYRSDRELADATDSLLRSPDLRKSIGQRGKLAVLERHQLSHRFQSIEEALVRRGLE